MTNACSYRVGVCSWSLQPSDPQQLVDRVRACGVHLVQLALSPLHESPDVWRDVAARLSDAGIAIASGMFGCIGENYSSLDTIRATGGLVPDATWPENQRVVERSLATAEALGLKMVSTHAGFIPHDRSAPSYRTMVERLRWVADRFAERGLVLLLETGQETADDLWSFLHDLDRDNVGINFDPANMILYDKGDPVASLGKLLPRVAQVHIKDAARTTRPGTWGRETAVGDGDVDWAAFAATLVSGGYRGDLLVEREAGCSRIDDVRRAARFIAERTVSASAKGGS